ncbi:MAG: sel1 repeat family protein [Synergistaceae bacterium]|nr:sel1 repeat family protein [Synergistaceae bacterium]
MMMRQYSALFLNEEGILHYKASEFAEAVSCWKEAAELGSASAIFELGVMHFIGCGVEKDTHKAMQLFRQAASLGHKNAGRYLESNNLAGLEAEVFEGNDSTDTNFSRIIKFGGYEWLLLESQGDTHLCLTKYIISIRPYHDRPENITWRDCTLRKWLNGEFIGSLSQEEQEMICLTNNDGADDKVFLLSADETEKYLGSSCSNARRTIINMTPCQIAECETLYKHSYAKVNGHSLGWWLRDSGSSLKKAARVNCSGKIRVYGRDVNSCIDGVRPACRVKFA